jgi:hypothetical protein
LLAGQVAERLRWNLPNDTSSAAGENAILTIDMEFSFPEGGIYVLEKPITERLAAVAIGIR